MLNLIAVSEFSKSILIEKNIIFVQKLLAKNDQYDFKYGFQEIFIIGNEQKHSLDAFIDTLDK